MPQYTVKAPDGRTLTLTGDASPSEADLDQIFSTIGATSQAPAQDSAQPAPQSGGLTASIGDMLGTAGNELREFATGAIKGAGQTATNLGALVHKIPGVDTVIDAAYGMPGLSRSAFAAANDDLKATNTAQSIGKGAEQIGELFIPAGAIAEAGKGLGLAGKVALEAGANAGMSAAQGGNPLVGGALGAVGGMAGKAIESVAPALKESAAKQVVQALGPTKERYKAMAERLTPEILKRGLRGSRESLQAQAADMASEAGQKIDDAIQAFGSRQVGVQPVYDALESAKGAFQTIGPHGQPVVLDKRAINQLDDLQSVVIGLGPDARVDQLVAVRRAWDRVVDQAGGFAHRAGGAIGMPLKDQSEAAIKREGGKAIRLLLDAEVPELSALNKEFSFWKGLDDTLTQTLKRTAPQKPGLLRLGAEAAGQVVGGVAGSTHGPAGTVGGAYALGKVAAMAQSVFESPRWKLASAQAKDALADAISANDVGRIATALSRIGATQGSKIGQ